MSINGPFNKSLPKIYFITSENNRDNTVNYVNELKLTNYEIITTNKTGINMHLAVIRNIFNNHSNEGIIIEYGNDISPLIQYKYNFLKLLSSLPGKFDILQLCPNVNNTDCNLSETKYESLNKNYASTNGYYIKRSGMRKLLKHYLKQNIYSNILTQI